MKKIGSHTFYNNVDLELKFTFDDIMEFFRKTNEGVKDEFFDKDGVLKLDTLDLYVKEYINQKVKEKYGSEYSLDVADDTMNISWDVKVESVKKQHLESWWSKKNPDIKKSTPPPITLEELNANPSLVSQIPEGINHIKR